MWVGGGVGWGGGWGGGVGVGVGGGGCGGGGEGGEVGVWGWGGGGICVDVYGRDISLLTSNTFVARKQDAPSTHLWAIDPMCSYMSAVVV